MVIARDLMTQAVTTVDPATSLTDLESRFVAEGVSCAPVVADGRLVGVGSRSDIVRAISEETERAEELVAEYYRDREPEIHGVSARNLILRESDIVAQRLAELTVRDVMSTRLISVGPNESAEKVARCMLTYRIHRVLVTEGDELLGIVSSLDVVQLVAEPEHVRATQSDVEFVCFTPDVEGEPSALFPGDATVATLRGDAGSGATTLLVRLPPGGRIEAHKLPESVQHLVLEGRYESEDTVYRTGTYRLIPKGEVPAITSDAGAVVLVMYEGVAS